MGLEPDQQTAGESHVVVEVGVDLLIVVWEAGIEIPRLKSKPNRYPQQTDNSTCVESGAEFQRAGIRSRSEGCASSERGSRRFSEKAREPSAERQPGSKSPVGIEFYLQMWGKKDISLFRNHTFHRFTH